MGRRTRLTPKVHDVIVDALEKGAYARVACEAAGVGESTYYAWLTRGEQSEADMDHPPLRDDYPNVKTWRAACSAWVTKLRADEPFREFREAVTRAGATAELMASTALLEALDAHRAVRTGENDYVSEPDHAVRVRAAAEFLKRRHPSRWTDGKRLEHTGAIVHATGLDTSRLTAEQLEALDEALLALPEEPV